MRFGPLALALVEASQAGGGASLEGLRLLVLGSCQSLGKTGACFRLIGPRLLHNACACEAMACCCIIVFPRVLSHHRDRPSRPVRALRRHTGGSARRRAGRGALSGRARRCAARPRLRAGDGLLEARTVSRAGDRRTVTQASASSKSGMARLALRPLALRCVRQRIVSPS
jgi:hypothetical protein